MTLALALSVAWACLGCFLLGREAGWLLGRKERTRHQQAAEDAIARLTVLATDGRIASYRDGYADGWRKLRGEVESRYPLHICDQDCPTHRKAPEQRPS